MMLPKKRKYIEIINKKEGFLVWIQCKCNYRIHDTTDYLSYKGHVFSDQDWFDFLDLVSEAIESNEEDRKKLVNEIYEASHITKRIYQCPKCGQLYIEDQPSGELCLFSPDSKVNKRLLESAYGSAWKGFLSAYWKDEIEEWQEHKGMIFPTVNINLENEKLCWDDREEFKKAYYSLFENLKGKNILRSSTLKINGKKVHDWSDDEQA